MPFKKSSQRTDIRSCLPIGIPNPKVVSLNKTLTKVDTVDSLVAYRDSGQEFCE